MSVCLTAVLIFGLMCVVLLAALACGAFVYALHRGYAPWIETRWGNAGAIPPAARQRR